MRHVDLFSGIGGFALAARWMNWETIQFVEIDSFCQKVLTKNFPNIPIHGDIKTFDGTKLRGSIDILTGGFPCQPFSTAGKRKGTEDDRHLWPEMLRVIGEVQPTIVVGENVYGLLNWSRGMVFEQVQTDLANIGYEVTPFVLPACGVNAPHRRDRVWFIAYSEGNNDRRKSGEFQESNELQKAERQEERVSESELSGGGYGKNGITSYNNNKGLQGSSEVGDVEIEGSRAGKFPARLLRTDWKDFPTQSPLCGGNDGIPYELYIIERLIDRIIEINEIKSSNKKSKSESSIAIWKAMRTMWQQREFAEASPRLWFEQMCNSLSILPCESGSIGWLQEGEEAKELRDMWGSFLPLSYTEAQNLQRKMLECYRQIERRKKVEKRDRVNRIKSLGNAIVPQVAFEIFKAIEGVKYIKK